MAANDAFHPVKAGSCMENQGCRRNLETGTTLVYLTDGSWALYPELDFGMGASWFQARVATPMSGSIEVRFRAPGTTGEEHEILAGTCKVPSTGGWDEWIHVNCPIQPVAGVQDVRLVFRQAGDNALFNLHSFSFAASTAGLHRETASKFRAADADSMSPNIIIEDSGDSDRGKSIGAIRNGDGIAFARVSLSENTNYFEARIATPAHGGLIDIHLIDLENDMATLAGTLAIPSTGSWDAWQTIGCEIAPARGRKILELVFRNDIENRLFKLNWFRFAAVRRTGADRVFPASHRIFAKDYTVCHSVQQEPSMEEGYNLAYLRDGSFVVFDSVDFGDTGLEYAAARVASAGTGGEIVFWIDGENMGSIQVDPHDSWQDWKTLGMRMPAPVKGIHKVRLHFRGHDGFLFNILWFSFRELPFPPEGIRITLEGKSLDLAAQWGGEPGQPPVLADLESLALALGLSAGTGTDGSLILGKDGLEALFRKGAHEVPCTLPDRGPVRPLRLEVPVTSVNDRLFAGVKDLAAWTGHLSQWCGYTGTMALKKSSVDRPRPRPRIMDGRFLADGMQPLRGVGICLDHENHAYPFAVLDRLKAEEFNALNVRVEMSAMTTGAYSLTPELDELVAYCAAEGLWMVLSPASGPLDGGVDEDCIQEFWALHGARYRHASHVIMELCREPCWSSPWPRDIREIMVRQYRRLREAAPDTPILVGSWSCMGTPEDMQSDLAFLVTDESDRKLTILASSGMDRNYAGIRKTLDTLRERGIPVISTGLAPEFRPGGVAPPAPDRNLIGVFETAGCGWLARMQASSLDGSGAFRTSLEEWGIHWARPQERRRTP